MIKEREITESLMSKNTVIYDDEDVMSISNRSLSVLAAEDEKFEYKKK